MKSSPKKSNTIGTEASFTAEQPQMENRESHEQKKDNLSSDESILQNDVIVKNTTVNQLWFLYFVNLFVFSS